MLNFIVIFIFFSLLPFPIAELLMYTMQPGRVFGFVGRKVDKIKNKFWYNSLGGCSVCFTQRIAEITYLLFVDLYVSIYGVWITHPLPWFLTVLLNIILFIGFTSVSFLLRSLKKEKKLNMVIDDQPANPTIHKNQNS